VCSAARSSSDLERIESEYIKNLQQQVYFLELEANYLYPSVITVYTVQLLGHSAAGNTNKQEINSIALTLRVRGCQKMQMTA